MSDDAQVKLGIDTSDAIADVNNLVRAANEAVASLAVDQSTGAQPSSTTGKNLAGLQSEINQLLSQIEASGTSVGQSVRDSLNVLNLFKEITDATTKQVGIIERAAERAKSVADNVRASSTAEGRQVQLDPTRQALADAQGVLSATDNRKAIDALKESKANEEGFQSADALARRRVAGIEAILEVEKAILALDDVLRGETETSVQLVGDILAIQRSRLSEERLLASRLTEQNAETIKTESSLGASRTRIGNKVSLGSTDELLGRNVSSPEDAAQLAESQKVASDLLVSRRLLAARTEETASREAEYGEATETVARTRQRQSIISQRAGLDESDPAEIGALKVGRERLARATELAASKLRDSSDFSGTVDAKVAAQEYARAIKISTVQLTEANDVVNLQEANKQLANAVREETIRRSNGQTVETEGDLRAAEAQLARLVQLQVAQTEAANAEDVSTVQAEIKSLRIRIAALTAEELNRTEGVVENLAATKIASEQQRLAVANATRGAVKEAQSLEAGSLEEAKVAELTASKADQLRRQLGVIKNQLQEVSVGAERDGEIAKIKGEILVSTKLLDRASKEEAREVLRQAQANGDIGTGTLFQRVSSKIRSRDGNIQLPEDQATGPQFLAEGAIQSARFALAGTAFFKSVEGLKAIVEEAQTLDRVLPQLQAQLEATGRSGDFDSLRHSIVGIAGDLGVSAGEVATVAQQLTGVFQDTEVAVANVQTAIKVSKITGEDFNKVINELTATAKTYGLEGKDAFSSVSDEALRVQEQTGVQAKEVLQFFGDVAPAAKEAGLSLREVGVISGATLQGSAKNAGALAESYNRVLPALQAIAPKLIEIYRNTPGLGGRINQLIGNIDDGNTGKAFTQLLQDYQTLAPAQQELLISQVAGRRETASLIPVFKNASVVLKELSDNSSAAGKTNIYFAEVQKSLQQQLSQLTEKAKLLGVALFDAGLKDFISDLLKIAEIAVGGLGGLVKVFADINSSLGGIPVKLLEVYAALRLIQAVGSSGVGTGIGTALSNIAVPAGSTAGLGSIEGAAVGGGFFARQSAAFSARQAAGRATADFAGRNVLGATLEEGVEGPVAASSFGSINAGASGALAGIGLGPLAISVAGLTAVLVARSKAADSIAKVRKSLDQEVASADIGGLLRGFAQAKTLSAGESNDNAVTRFADNTFLNGASLASTEEAKKLKKAIAGSKDNLANLFFVARKLQDQGLFDAPVSIEKDLELLAAGDSSGANDIIDAIAKNINNKDFSDKLNSAVNDLNQQKNQQSKIDQAVEERQKTLAEAQAAFSANEVGSLGSLLVALQGQLPSEQAALEGLLTNLATDKDTVKSILAYRKQLSASSSKALDLRLGAIDLGGGENNAGKVDALSAALNSPDSGITDPNDRAKFAKELITALQAQLKQEASAAGDAVAAKKILDDGIKIPDSARSAILREFLDTDVPLQVALEGLALNEAEKSKILNDIADSAAKNNESTSKAAASILQSRLDDVKRAARIDRGDTETQRQLREAQKAVDAINKDPGITVPDSVSGKDGQSAGGNVATTEKTLDDLRRRLAAAQGVDPIVTASKRLTAAVAAVTQFIRKGTLNTKEGLEAQIEVADAQKELRSAQKDQSDALFNLFQAQNADDPVAVARESLRHANEVASRAVGQVEKANAAAEQIKANDAIADALRSIFEAQEGLLIAADNALGNQTDAANEQVKIAQRQLDDRISQDKRLGTDPLNDPEALKLQAGLTAAKSAAEQSNISEQRDQINFDLEFKKISTGQAIAKLKALESLTKNSDTIRDIERQIRSLSQQSQQDLQFNIPTDLGLPTLYEARRVSQTPGGSRAYTDARNYQIQIVVPQGTSAQQASKIIADAIGGPPVVTPSRIY